MDRELKFRVWDKYSGKSPTGGMHYFDAMEICDNGLFFKNSKFDLEQNHNDDESAVVMQYTGLKDKNGKEIYEGDIFKQGNYPYTWHIVSFTKGAFNISVYSTQKGKVMGNIFENPEILESLNKEKQT